MINIQEYHEFSYDMIRTLPKVNFYHTNNIDTTVKCKQNISSIYKNFSNNVIETDYFDQINDGCIYNHYAPEFTNNNWLPPNLKDIYKNNLSFNKETLVIQNKYTEEWGLTPCNYFSIKFLDHIFNLFKNKYQIIYIKPKKDEKKYFYDANIIMEFNDYKLIKDKHPEVITICDLMESNPDMDYNSLQFSAHATSTKHLTVSGGNACISAYFGGEVIIYDSLRGPGANRGIWKTDSWLKKLSNSKIIGFNDYNLVLDYMYKNW